MRVFSRHNHLLAAVVAMVAVGGVAPSTAQDVHVAITAIVEHPSLDTVRDGITDVLARAGYVVGGKLALVFESADADTARAAEIAAAFAAAEPDVIVAISAPSALALVATATAVPIVIAAIDDDDAQRILAARSPSGGAVIGIVESEPPLLAHLLLLRTILPDVTTVTVPYDRDDPRPTLDALRDAGAAVGLEIDAVPMASDADIAALVKRGSAPDAAIYLPADSLAAAKVEAFFSDADAEFYPRVFAGAADSVVRGAVATVGYDPYEVGRQAGQLVLRILGGEDPTRLAVRPARATHVIINVEAAELMGITVPAGVLDSATEIIEAQGPRPRSKPPVPDR